MGGVGAFELEGETQKESTTAKPGYGHVPTETVRDRTAGMQEVEQCTLSDSFGIHRGR